MSLKKAVKIINEVGGILVFPLDNRPLPLSLWAKLYPKTSMRWEWDESGDNRVAELWHLRTELSQSDEVVYSKWCRGRATLFSREVFEALLSGLAFSKSSLSSLGKVTQQVLMALEEDSPLSTKALKKKTGLRGRDQENLYSKSLKQLWERGLIVGYGEVDDGAFPSLAIGATQLIFDDLWARAKKLSREKANQRLQILFKQQPLFKKEFDKVKQGLLRNPLESSLKGTLKAKDLFPVS